VLVPYIKEGARRARRRLEAPTKVDAMLLAPTTGFAVLFEAKVLSDISGWVRFDVLRNQLARNVDVMLEENRTLKDPLRSRRPDRSCLVLVTPEVFRRHPDGRLYGCSRPTRVTRGGCRSTSPTAATSTSRRWLIGSDGSPGRT
jgi:hypothetical protein